MNVFLGELARVCRAFPLREKILVSPSMLPGHEALESLAVGGVAWANLRPRTPLDLAWSVAEPVFARRGVKRITRGQALHLVELAIEDMRERGGFRYLDPLKSPLGPAPALLGAIRELRMAGVSASDLDPGSFVDPRKGEEIRDILAAYEGGLTAGMLADDAGAMAAALEVLRDDADDITADGPVYLIPHGAAFAPLTFEFLAALSDGRRVVLGCDPVVDAPDPPGIRFDLEERQQGNRPRAGGESPSKPGAQSLLSWLFRPEGSPSGPARPNVDANVDVRFHAAYGTANEVRQVFRSLRSEGIPADAAVAVYTSGPAYIPLFMSQSAMLGIPVTFGEGVPVISTRPGGAVLALLRWVGEGYQAGLLRRLFMSGDVDIESPLLLTRALRQANIGWGRDRYALLLDSSGDAARRALADWVDDVLSRIPEPDGRGLVSMRSLCLGVEHFARNRSRICGDLDASAVEALAAMLEDLPEAVLRDQIPLGEALSRIAAETGTMYAGESRPLPGHLHVTGIRGPAWGSRPNTFIVGLDASGFPGDSPQDPVLLDIEREAISPRLAPRSAETQARLRGMAEMLASRRGRVWLVYSCYDVAESRPCFPSPFMLQAYRLVSGELGAGYGDLERATGDPAAYAPATTAGAVTGGEWWLCALRRKDFVGDAIDEVRKAYPRLDAGLRARAARESDVLTAYDGLIAACPPDMRDAVHSTSTLEDLASCPFYYFLARVLRVECPRDLEYDPGRWLDAATRGRLLHSIYSRCLEEGLGGNGRYLDRDRVMEIAGEAIAACRDEAPPPSELVYEFEAEGLRRSLDVFVRVQGEMAGRMTPVLLEAPFGLSPDGDAGDAPVVDALTGVAQPGHASAADSPPGNPAVPLEVPLPGGSRILVMGRVDRIDRINAGDGHSYAVWDYKTGSAFGYEERGFVRKGTQIQHAVYARAAESMLRETGIDSAARVDSSGYLFLTEKGEGRIVARPARKWERTGQVIERIVEIGSSGAFHPTTDSARCRWCEFSPACGGVRSAEGSKVKAESGKNALFRPWKELQEYE